MQPSKWLLFILINVLLASLGVPLTENVRNSRKPLGNLNTLLEYTTWAAKDEDIAAHLSKRLEQIDAEINLITDYLHDHKTSTAKAVENMTELENSPEDRGILVGSSVVLGHRMTSRFAGVVSDLRKLLASTEYQNNQEEISKILEPDSDNWVDQMEMYLSMDSLIHIQEIYGYKPEEMFSGFGFENGTGVHMTIGQCLDMGAFALYRKNYYMSIEWLQITLKKLLTDATEFVVTEDLVNSVLSVSVQEHNRMLRLAKQSGDLETSLNLFKRTDNHELIGYRHIYYHKNRQFGMSGSDEAQFMDRCRGNVALPAQMQKNLKCYFEKSRHPYLHINPIKVEVLSVEPDIFQFYDMIQETEIQELHKFGQLSMYTYNVPDGVDSLDSLARFRTSVGREILPEKRPRRAMRLVDMVTGLVMMDDADTRISAHYLEYTYGRIHNIHSDSLSGAPLGDDRMVTALYYLEVPEESGYTGFCQAGIFPRQVRGSVVFWYNSYRNGSARVDLFHGGCPVLHGHKIIMSHGTRQNVHWQTYKCSLNQFE